MNRLASRSVFVWALMPVALGPIVRADFIIVEDFDALALGPIDDQNDWVASSASTQVIIDPANAANLVLAVTTNSTIARHPCLLLDETRRMLFVRFRFAGQQTYSFGLSDSAAPDQFGDFEVELSMSNASNDLRINDDGNYVDIGELQPDTWYQTWVFIDNQTNSFEVYLHSRPTGPATPADRLAVDGQTSFVFRDGAARDLRTFFIKTGGGSSGNSGPLYLDAIHLEDSADLNLRNPAVGMPDFDDDGDVDADDSIPFIACLNGPGVEIPPTGCTSQAFALADVDRDGDVDLADYAGFVVQWMIGSGE